MGGRGMSAALPAFARHFRVRLGAVLRDPGALLVLAGAAAATLLLWPGVTPPGDGGWSALSAGAEPAPEALEGTTVFLWLLIWPVLPVTAAAGRVAPSARGDAFAQRGCPALPVTLRARMLAEALLVLLAVALAHGARSLLPGAPAPAPLLAGAFVSLPVLLAWATPAPSVALLWIRPSLVVLALSCAAETGLLASPAGVVATGTALAAAVLAGAHVDLSALRSLPHRPDRPPAAARPALDAARRLRRDFFLEPLRRLGPFAASLLFVLAGVLAVEAVRPIPPFVAMAVAILVLSQIFALALRPAGSALVPWAFRGSSGARAGDLVRAFSVLPVRPESVRRAAYVHGLVVALAAWGGSVGVVALRALSRTGRLALTDADGDSLLPLLLLGLCVVPVAAGLVVSAAAGDGRRMALSGGALLALLNLPGMAFLVVASLLGMGSRAGTVAALGLIAVLTLAGSLPPLALLRRGRRPPAPVR